jgi:hypothetical protein
VEDIRLFTKTHTRLQLLPTHRVDIPFRIKTRIPLLILPVHREDIRLVIRHHIEHHLLIRQDTHLSIKQMLRVDILSRIKQMLVGELKQLIRLRILLAYKVDIRLRILLTLQEILQQGILLRILLTHKLPLLLVLSNRIPISLGQEGKTLLKAVSLRGVISHLSVFQRLELKFKVVLRHQLFKPKLGVELPQQGSDRYRLVTGQMNHFINRIVSSLLSVLVHKHSIHNNRLLIRTMLEVKHQRHILSRIRTMLEVDIHLRIKQMRLDDIK